ncbi:DUF4365 domain-containing protein [Bradyrhizobium japonicum]|uniref:DUF4365 domain-containing protein n=1 Tax=Bradyrhizobium japonicum TaxID=375 RepID=UPI001BA9B228|nr:DUF4365 domain-containing protein [Bradyrhizobium japonicum]MBR0764409.1 DUF4365 domain-containing protein [Bradyrhizobium japonicum]
MKKISEQQRIGEQGVHLLGARLLSVGLSFQPNGPLDAGIDGFLELRDPVTGEVRAQWITAQLKTQKEGRLTEETDESFSYLCRQEDLDYWLGSNVPVVLFFARLSDECIYWKALHSWFSDADRRRTRKVFFDKTKDALNEDALPGLVAAVASFSAPGRIVPSTRMAEMLNSNLLKVSFPAKTHVAESTSSYSEVREALVERYGNPPVDWILRGKRIYSFRDISIPPFRDVIEEGSEETVDTLQWSESDGDVTRRLLVELLNKTLSEMVREPLSYWRDGRYLFWKLGRGKLSRSYSYRSFEKNTSRDVVKSYTRKDDDKPSYFRHDAFHANFVRIAGEWYLAVEPTYHFTSDGYHEFRFAADRMSGIKRLETNQSVRGHIGMWTAFLVRQPDLLRKDPLVFTTMPALGLPFGVPDDLWRENEADEEKTRMEKAQLELL